MATEQQPANGGQNTTAQTGAERAPRAGDRESAAQLGPAEEQTDERKAMGDRKRDAIWEEVHDPFDTRTAVVDPRASGDPIGSSADPMPTGPESLP